MGNPLLDIQVTNAEELLKKYDLKSNDAILAQDKHQPIYDEIVTNHQVIYVAGGGSQNTARAAAYALRPNSVVYTGCVGDDDLAEQLKAANTREGLDELYLVKKGERTGACAAILTGNDRSLVTTLRAAEKFEQSHLSSPAVAKAIDEAKFYYVEGFFLTHGFASVLELAKKAFGASKSFALNFSAPFIPQFFNSQLLQILPYTDIVICNESEAASWAQANGIETKDLGAIATAIAGLDASRARTVVITHGAEPTTVVRGDDQTNVKTYPVHPLKAEELVDTNGAGDAFAGGFLAALVVGKALEEAVDVGHKLARLGVTQIGPTYPWPKVSVL